MRRQEPLAPGSSAPPPPSAPAFVPGRGRSGPAPLCAAGLESQQGLGWSFRLAIVLTGRLDTAIRNANLPADPTAGCSRLRPELRRSPSQVAGVHRGTAAARPTVGTCRNLPVSSVGKAWAWEFRKERCEPSYKEMVSQRGGRNTGNVLRKEGKWGNLGEPTPAASGERPLLRTARG